MRFIFLLLLVFFFESCLQIFTCYGDAKLEEVLHKKYEEFAQEVRNPNIDETIRINPILGENGCFVTAVFLYHSYYRLVILSEELEEPVKKAIALSKLLHSKTFYVVDTELVLSRLKENGIFLSNSAVKKLIREWKKTLSLYLLKDFLAVESYRFDGAKSVYIGDFQITTLRAYKKLKDLQSRDNKGHAAKFAMKPFIEHEGGNFPDQNNVPVSQIIELKKNDQPATLVPEKVSSSTPYITIYEATNSDGREIAVDGQRVLIPQNAGMHESEFDSFMVSNIRGHIPSASVRKVLAKYMPLQAENDTYFRILHVQFEIIPPKNIDKYLIEKMKMDQGSEKEKMLLSDEEVALWPTSQSLMLPFIRRLSKHIPIEQSFIDSLADQLARVMHNNNLELLSELSLSAFSEGLKHLKDYDQLAATDDFSAELAIFAWEALRWANRDLQRNRVVHEINSQLAKPFANFNGSPLSFGDYFNFLMPITIFSAEFPKLSQWLAQLRLENVWVELRPELKESQLEDFASYVEHSTNTKRITVFKSDNRSVERRKIDLYLDLICEVLRQSYCGEKLSVQVTNFTLPDYIIILNAFLEAPSFKKVRFINLYSMFRGAAWLEGYIEHHPEESKFKPQYEELVRQLELKNKLVL